MGKMQVTTTNLDLCYFYVHSIIRNYDSLISVSRCFCLFVLQLVSLNQLSSVSLRGCHCKVPTSHDYVLVHHQYAASAINTIIFTIINLYSLFDLCLYHLYDACCGMLWCALVYSRLHNAVLV